MGAETAHLQKICIFESCRMQVRCSKWKNMELQHIQHIINQGEGLNVEFKKATDELPANLFETVPCFFIFSARKNRLKIGRAEELGTGIRKIFKYSSLYSGDVPKVVEGDVFEVVVPLLTTTKTTSKTTSKTQVQILDYLRFKPRTTARELALLLGLSEEGVRYHIKKLKTNKQLTYKGTPRSGEWVVIIKRTEK